MAKSRSQLVNLPGARPLMNPLSIESHLCAFPGIGVINWGCPGVARAVSYHLHVEC